MVLAGLVALFVWGRGRIHFDFAVFKAQLAQAEWWRIAVGAGCILLGYLFRSVRWALLLRHNKKVPLLGLLSTQVIGFTAVALIGRVADPVRAYLVAKKTGLPLSSQVAVYIVERLFDAGSMALIFSTTIAFTAWFGAPGALPHAEVVKKAGEWGLLLTVAGAAFLFAVRLAGGAVASVFEGAFGLISKKLGAAVGHKIRTFHTGLDTIRTFGEFGAVAALSLGMWMLIAMAYWQTTLAFVSSPELGSMTLAKCMLLLAFSGGASIFQMLPVIGWFSQIGVMAEAVFHGFFGVAREPAWACSAMLLVVTMLVIVPVGLVWAQLEHVSLRKVTVESEIADEQLEEAT